MCDHSTELKDMKEKLAALESKLRDNEIRNVEQQRSKERTKVIFSAEAGARGAIGPYSSETTLVFQRVITNVGNAYNQHSGIFTAPSAGVYFFTIFHHAGGNPGSQLLLYRNSEQMVMTQDHPSNNVSAHNGGNAVSLQLQQGDQVYVRMSANTHVYGSNYHTTFNGFLVSQM